MLRICDETEVNALHGETNYYGWHICKNDTLRDGTPVPPDNKWLLYEGEIEWCKSGLYSAHNIWKSLRYSYTLQPSDILCRVITKSHIIRNYYKGVSYARYILWRTNLGDVLSNVMSQVHIDYIDKIKHKYGYSFEKLQSYVENYDPASLLAAKKEFDETPHFRDKLVLSDLLHPFEINLDNLILFINIHHRGFDDCDYDDYEIYYDAQEQIPSKILNCLSKQTGYSIEELSKQGAV